MSHIRHYDMHELEGLTTNYKAYVIAHGLSVPEGRIDIYNRWLDAMKVVWVWSKLKVTDRAQLSRRLDVNVITELLAFDDIIARLVKNRDDLHSVIAHYFNGPIGGFGHSQDFESWVLRCASTNRADYISPEVADEIQRLTAIESG